VAHDREGDSLTERQWGSRGIKQLLYLTEGYLYTALWPALRSSRRMLYPPPHPKEIGLTFDDGPNPACTLRLLDILSARQIRAAFFLVGKFAESQPSLVRRITAEGHVIGNHTWSHPNLATIPLSQVRQELQCTKTLLEQITGTVIPIFRPPYGACNPEVLSQARTLGMLPVFWNAITLDWEDRSAPQIVEDLAQQIEHNRQRRRATCLVLHDGRADHSQTGCAHSVEAASQLISLLHPEYRFVSIRTW
jgi:peptidoglycan-N-acetylglucosamine deacetylase